MSSINTSIFDVFKIGPGPSSAHTIGPMRAAKAFIDAAAQLPEETLASAATIKVYLYGSLSATGKEHGTDRAVVAGLLGQQPETCDPDGISQLLSDSKQIYSVKISGKIVPFKATDIIFANANDVLPFAHTMRLDLLDRHGEKLLSKIYYSLGGGFIRCEGELEPGQAELPYPYANLRQFTHLLKHHGLSPIALLLANEHAISGLTDEDIFQRLDLIIAAMETAVERGLNTTGVLPGVIVQKRQAADIFAQAAAMPDPMDRGMLMINALAMAAAEENAAGGIVVTAPTSVASGVIPGIIYLLKRHFHIEAQCLREGLLIAALIAFVSRHHVGISEIEAGCQSEVGVASAMAAALVAHIKGYPMSIVENAAALALELHLGMTCAPICEHIQIPCIERNAIAAITAYNACLLAVCGNPPKHKRNFDTVVEVMLETGRDTPLPDNETSHGALSTCSIRR